ncbi:MAG: hypothetical protein LBK67_12145, partial [Coriobacteriales bacterium]|jgi:membrane protein implicated in regulation of membrane protease activity|nr:hypothetical protein [Coriobacteriales bacterium]
LTIILGIISPIVFFLTENMTLPLVIVDKWTLLMATFVIVQVVLTLVMWQVRKITAHALPCHSERSTRKGAHPHPRSQGFEGP